MALYKQRTWILIGLAILVMFGLAAPLKVIEAKETTASHTLYIDGKLIEYKKLKVDNRLENMISMATVTTKLNMKLKWVTKNKEWILSNADHTIQMKLDSKTATVDTKQQKITTPAILNNGTIYLPLRFIVVSGGGVLYTYPGIPVYWVLSADQIKLKTALVLNNMEEARSRLKEWRDATIPMGIDGLVPYIYAAENIEMVKLLLEKGFPVNYQEYEYDGILLNGWRTTLLHQAASLGNVEVVKFLLEQGADPSLKDALGRTSIDSAVTAKGWITDRFSQVIGGEAAMEDYDLIIELLQDQIKTKGQ